MDAGFKNKIRTELKSKSAGRNQRQRKTLWTHVNLERDMTENVLFAIKSQVKISHSLKIVMGYLKELFKDKKKKLFCLPRPPKKREANAFGTHCLKKKTYIVTDGFHFANNLTTV